MAMLSQVMACSTSHSSGRIFVGRLGGFDGYQATAKAGGCLSRGEIVAGPLDIGETLSLKKKVLPVAWAAPSEGMFMFDQTFNLLKNGPNKDAACAFLDYMLSEDVQTKLALPERRTTERQTDRRRGLYTRVGLQKIDANAWATDGTNMLI
jgi:ABC-type glycerol-3-phosphate transport system substrate-binding protein